MLANKLMSAALSGGAEDKLYVDDVFSTYLYTGNGSTQTINNGIDLAGKGGMVWSKVRSGTFPHALVDTLRGKNVSLSSNQTDGNQVCTGDIANFNSNGITYNTPSSTSSFNQNGSTYVNYFFRRSPKFFDSVTYTGNGVAGRQIPHALGIVPGMIVIKCTNNVQHWIVNHRSLAVGDIMLLASTGPASALPTSFGNDSVGVAPTSADFTIGTNINALGGQYIAYLFAHDPSADGIIQCGSFTTDASGNATVNLGWEPQYVLVKQSASVQNWYMYDSARGLPAKSGLATLLFPNLSNAEAANAHSLNPTATGFEVVGGNSPFGNSTSGVIYLAIRRPNKPPTTGTEVYKPLLKTGNGSTQYQYPGFQPDTYWSMFRDSYTQYSGLQDVLRGGNVLITSDTGNGIATSVKVGSVATGRVDFSGSDWNNSNSPMVDHFFRRAPGFFDVVCYTGTGVARTVPHSLGVAPELMIVKSRSSASLGWAVYPNDPAKYVVLNSSAGLYNDNTGVVWNSLAPTATHFSVGSGETIVNLTGATFVAYLFATLPGISKVGSYTGNGTTQTINCGFTTGARFILIKRTDSTGDWYIWDTARGIVSANDPHLSLNTTAVEVTTDDSVDPASSGFIVNQNTATNINVTGGSYIYFSVA